MADEGHGEIYLKFLNLCMKTEKRRLLHLYFKNGKGYVRLMLILMRIPFASYREKDKILKFKMSCGIRRNLEYKFI